MWESVETAPGVYDMNYLNNVEALIQRFADYGMVTIVDNHQDLFSRKLCGEGVPHFYTPIDLDHKCPMTPLAQAFHLADECISFEDLNLIYDINELPLVSEC